MDALRVRVTHTSSSDCDNFRWMSPRHLTLHPETTVGVPRFTPLAQRRVSLSGVGVRGSPPPESCILSRRTASVNLPTYYPLTTSMPVFFLCTASRRCSNPRTVPGQGPARLRRGSKAALPLGTGGRGGAARATRVPHREHGDRPAGVQPRQAGSCQRVWQRNPHLREGRARCCGLTPHPGRARGLRA